MTATSLHGHGALLHCPQGELHMPRADQSLGFGTKHCDNNGVMAEPFAERRGEIARFVRNDSHFTARAWSTSALPARRTAHAPGRSELRIWYQTLRQQRRDG